MDDLSERKTKRRKIFRIGKKSASIELHVKLMWKKWRQRRLYDKVCVAKTKASIQRQKQRQIENVVSDSVDAEHYTFSQAVSQPASRCALRIKFNKSAYIIYTFFFLFLLLFGMDVVVDFFRLCWRHILDLSHPSDEVQKKERASDRTNEQFIKWAQEKAREWKH